MGIKVVLEFSDEDLGYFRQMMDSVWKRNSKRSEKEIVSSAREQLAEAMKNAGAEYVQSRLKDIEVLTSMLEDADWPLEKDDRNRMLVAVGYFGVANDLIPDKTPGIGYLDDALMAELVIRELKPELEGYRDFCTYRDNEMNLRGKKTVSREDWLAAKRRQVWLRIRRQREERRYRSSGDPTLPILRYQY